MSLPTSNASTSRSIPASRVILLDDDDEAVLRPTPLTDEDALKLTSHDNGFPKQDEVREEQDARGDLEELLAVEDVEESDDDDDVEEYLEDILHTLLETEGATEQDANLPPSEVCTPEEITHYRSLLRELGTNKFIEETVTTGRTTPRKLCTAFNVAITPIIDLLSSLSDSSEPEDQDDATTNIWYRLLGMAIMRFLLHRQKLPQYNTIDNVVELLRTRKNILVITGAGISTNLGIPDFRSKDTGFYSKMSALGIDNPEDIFDLQRFKDDPKLFFEHAGETFPNLKTYSPTHGFIRLLQDKDKLLTNYTQNIDNLEEVAGIHEDKLIQCHGSWASATCMTCDHKVRGSSIRETVTKGKVPYCPVCIQRLSQPAPTPQPVQKRKRSPTTTINKPTKRRNNTFDFDVDASDSSDTDYNIPQPGVLKPDITFFGEQLPTRFFDRFRHHDMARVDLVLVIGTSLKVAPVSEIPLALPPEVPQVYVSREVCRHVVFDVTLLGDCDVVVGELVRRAGWQSEGGGSGQGAVVECTDEEKGWWAVVNG